jgi:hypothetical protein
MKPISSGLAKRCEIHDFRDSFVWEEAREPSPSRYKKKKLNETYFKVCIGKYLSEKSLSVCLNN